MICRIWRPFAVSVSRLRWPMPIPGCASRRTGAPSIAAATARYAKCATCCSPRRTRSTANWRSLPDETPGPNGAAGPQGESQDVANQTLARQRFGGCGWATHVVEASCTHRLFGLCLVERKTLATIFVLAVLALGAQILAWVFMPHEHAREFVGPPRSDYTLSTFTLDALDDAGKLSFSVTGPRLAHKEEDGSVYVTTPDYVMVDNSGNLWKGKSESAWVNKDGTIMKLEGAVDMHRIPTATVTPVQLITSDLTVTTSPKEKNATDPKPREKRMETA